MKESYEFWCDQGSRLANSGDYAGAIAAYTKALEVPSTSLTSQYQQRVQLWQSVMELNIKSNNPQVWLQHGLILNQLGSYEESIVSFSQALSINPNLVEALCYQGYAFLQLKHLVKAIGNYCRILDISPNYSELHYLEIPIKELKKGEFSSFFQSSLAVQPEFPLDDFNISNQDEVLFADHSYSSIVQGNKYLKQGDYQKAVESYRKIERFSSCGLFMGHSKRYWNIVAWNNCGLALHQLGHLEQAISEYEKAATSFGSFPKAWYNQGLALEAIGHFEKAESIYSKALQSTQLYPAAWYRHGLVLEQLAQYDNATKSFENALDISQVFNNQEIETLARKKLKRISFSFLSS